MSNPPRRKALLARGERARVAFGSVMWRRRSRRLIADALVSEVHVVVL